MAASVATANRGRTFTRRKIVGAAIAAIVLGGIVFDTHVVRIGSEQDLRKQAFDPDRFGAEEFPRIRAFVVERAAKAPELASLIGDDKNAAIAAHGTMAGAFPVMAVAFTGVAGAGKSGIFEIRVEGMPGDTSVRVQTGPAINGTELRDIVGDIEFGAFRNQIEYQDAGAAINRAMSAETLSDLDRDDLTGKRVAVVGAFTLINPKNWLVTPVSLEVK